MKNIKHFWVVSCVMALPFFAIAQPQYSIGITQQQYELKTGFLKMGANVSPAGETLSYNNLYLIKNGQPWFPIMGEMHFSRCAAKDWENSILKMKAAGIQIISTYVFWNHHEATEGMLDWTGNFDIHQFLSLCKKHGMYVWLRLGPWVHAEARNGGFPDWLLQKSIPLRTGDAGYLSYTKGWFTALYSQCDGFLYKQGGTVIGAQLENELEFKKPEAYQYMKTLKSIAITAGFDLPYYSVFGQGSDTQDEFLYTMGGYPESPWAMHTKKMYKSTFYIQPLKADTDIGSDLFGKVDAKVRNTYPKLGAEVGSGMQKTYHRRVNVSSKDVGATAFTRVADGLNGMGYYMFHGGVNPIGKTSLQESRVTNYPNDLSYINYDFQAPIGAMGIVRESFYEFRLLDRFLQDFGSGLSTEKPFFPKAMVATPFSNDTVQASIRVHNNTGFIFLSNYQRFVDLPPVSNFQLHLTTENGVENIPAKPIGFPANSYSVWPYHLNMNGAVLQYATAQPFCTLNTTNQNQQKADSYVFFADQISEWVFDASTIKNIKAISHCSIEKNVLKANTSNDDVAIFTVLSSSDNQLTTIIVLSRKMALQAAKIKVQGKELLTISEATVIADGDNFIVEKVGDEKVKLRLFPKTKLAALSNLIGLKEVLDANSFFTNYQLFSIAKPVGRVTVQEIKNGYDTVAARLFEDSVLHGYATLGKKYFNPKQPGQIYQLQFHDLPGQRKYSVSFNTSTNDLATDWIAGFNYVGDVIALYKKDSLIYDQFNDDDYLKIKMSDVLQQPNSKLLAQILPFNKNYDIYVEDNMQAEKEKDWLDARLKNVDLQPVFDYKVKIIN